MKSLIFSAFFAVSGLISAATVNVGNLNDPDNSNGIVTSTGALIQPGVGAGSGSVQIGYFSGVSDVTAASLSTLVSSFVPYGNVVNFGAGINQASLFEGPISGASIDSTAFAGQDIYLVVTNAAAGFTGAGATTATEFLVWDPNIAFPTGEPFNSSINVQSGGGGSVVPGKGGFNDFTINFGDGDVPAYNLVAIPEPSAALLGALGMIGLLRRRRVA
jgi:hypothetical protein